MIIMIPKIIWQTHNYRYEDLPVHILKCSKTWQNLNPSWRYNYFSHEDRHDFVKSEIPELYDEYLKLAPMYQADLWRYVVIYKYGGVYADMDSICYKPLDYMLSKYSGQDVVCVKPAMQGGKINNANFAASRKSDSIKNVIDLIRRYKENTRFKDEPLRHLVWEAFNQTMKQKTHEMWFDAEMHSQDFKSSFPEFDVDYCGEIMNYRDYLQNILKLKGEKYNSSVNEL
jgi:mannosyltransferase OCH1-like enzyme